MDARSELDPNQPRNLRMVPDILAQAALLAAQLATTSSDDLSSEQLTKAAITFNEKADYVNAKKYSDLALAKVELDTTDVQQRASIKAHCHYVLANVERELGNDAEAARYFEYAQSECKLLQENEASFKLHYEIERNLGITLLKLKKHSQAASCFLTALTIAETFKLTGRAPAVKSYHGLCLVLSGKHDDGFAELHAARELYPVESREQSMDWASHRYHMAVAYQAVSNHEYALAEFHESHRLRTALCASVGPVYRATRLGDVCLGLGESYFAVGKFEASRRYLDDAKEHFSVVKNAKKIADVDALFASFPAPLAAGPLSGLMGAGMATFQRVPSPVAGAPVAGAEPARLAPPRR